MRPRGCLTDLLWFLTGVVAAAHESKPHQTSSRAGYVYLVEAIGQKGLYKIGHTTDPKRRRSTFKLALPFDIEYLHLIPCRDRYAAEKVLHARYAAKRLRSDETGRWTEWFRLSRKDVRDVQSIKKL